ncbi:MAG: serine/threonine-protein phosphatase [Candidatus Eremiobacteraeota bacterium]|nr:serine/threonine-protein phosphatase [Candidatus Eremiobacteraeota bacterium]
MEVAVGSELGVWQKRQTDAHLEDCVAPSVTLFGIADGFGELDRGLSIAPAALATVRDYLRRRHRVGSFGRNVSPSALRAILLAALDHANARLYAQSGSHEDFVGSGTSLTAVMIVGHHAFVGHVGDARAYLMRLGRLELMTADDAMFADTAVPSAKTSLPARPRMRGLLWRSLGTQAKLEASIAHVELLSGDQLVLCTDGVHQCVDDDELGEALADCDRAADVVARMLATARSRGGVDNGTLIVARDLLAAPAPAFAAGVRGRAMRVSIAIGLLVVSLLSYGVFALRTGFTDHTPGLTSSER